MPIGTLDNSKSSRNAPPCSTPPRGGGGRRYGVLSFVLDKRKTHSRTSNVCGLRVAVRPASFVAGLSFRNPLYRVSRRLRAPRTLPARYGGGGFRHPPASARRSRVLPSVICTQGLRKCLSAPLRSVPSVSPSAPSASVARGRLRASPWLQTPAGVPRLKTLAPSPPRFPPCRNPFSRLRSKRGGFRRRNPQGVAPPQGWRSRPPRLRVASLRAR